MNSGGTIVIGGLAIGTIIVIAILVFIFLLIVAGITLLIVFLVSNSKHKNFAITNSVAIRKLKEINKKYHFSKLYRYDYRNTYDNEDFYRTISCKDYLVYELQFKQSDAWKEIKKSKANRKLFNEYVKEIKDSHLMYGKFVGDVSKFNKKKLIKYEKEEVKRITLSPATNSQIKVTLIRTLINGRRMESKSKTFYEQEIVGILNGLKNKRGSFYLNNEIWESICRVERGKVSNKLRFAIYERDHNRCRICGSRRNLEIDHIYPIAKGGKSTYDNLQTLCHRCNMRKGASVK